MGYDQIPTTIKEMFSTILQSSTTIGYYIKHVSFEVILGMSTATFLKVTTESLMTQFSKSQTYGLTFFTCYQYIHTPRRLSALRSDPNSTSGLYAPPVAPSLQTTGIYRTWWSLWFRNRNSFRQNSRDVSLGILQLVVAGRLLFPLRLSRPCQRQKW